MKKRILSFLMALLTVFTMLPVNALAETADTGEEDIPTTDIYFIDDTVWLPAGTTPSGATVETGEWVQTSATQTKTVQICTLESHSHVYICPTDDTGFTCGGHFHSDGCKAKIYDHEEHIPTDACSALVYGCGLEENPGHQHEENCFQLICTIPNGEGAHSHTGECYTTGKQLTCEYGNQEAAEENVPDHEHTDACYTDSSELTCGLQETLGHQHDTQVCYQQTCTISAGDGAHTHSEDCPSAPACTVEAHTHNENCTFTYGDYICGQSEHTHVTEGCTADCAIAEHTHGDDCYETITEVKWVVQLKDDSWSTLETQKLPVHFFVATLEEAQDPWGRYADYKDNQWGTRDGNSGVYASIDFDLEENKQIKTQQGIRARMTESDILKYVEWPAGVTADSFRTFSDPITIDRQSYSGSDYEVQWVTICFRGSDGTTNLSCYCGVNYAHIHIDGILTKKIKPGTMLLHKMLTQTQPVDQTFQFKLYQLALDSNYDPTTTRLSSIDMTATVPAGKTTATIAATNNLDSDTTNDVEIGFGYYELVEETKTGWENTYNLLGSTNVDPGSIFINIHTNGTVEYSTNATSGYTTYSAGATVVNAPKPEYNVTYQFYADNQAILDSVHALVHPPVDSNTYAANDTVNIDTTVFPTGRQVENLSTGKIYTFQGWDSWEETSETASAPGKNTLTSSSLSMPGNHVTVYGKWTEADLENATGYINVKKIFNGLPLGKSASNDFGTDMNAQLTYPDEFHVAQTQVINDVLQSPVSTMMEESVALKQSTLTETVGTTTQAVWAGEEYAYSHDGIFLLEEHSYTIPGYSVETVIETDLLPNHVTTQESANGDGVYLTVTLPHKSALTAPAGVLDDAEDLGTVTFINTYTKNTGEDIYVLPDLDIHKLDAATGQGITTPDGGVGASFTLYKATKDPLTGVYTKTDEVYKTGTTSQSGHLSFTDLDPGDYVLLETQAPTGYLLSDTEYGFSVVLESTDEVLEQNAFVKKHTYIITDEAETGKASIEAPASEGAPYHIHIENAKENGSITITKQFYGESNTDLSSIASGYIELSLEGPYKTADTSDSIPGITPKHIDVEIRKTDDGWTHTSHGLTYGWYHLTEDMASITDYYWDKSQTQITVGDDNAGIGNAVWIQVTSDEDIGVQIVNHYQALTEAELWIQKVDANNTSMGLNGAVFGLYTDSNFTDLAYITHSAEGDGFLHIDKIDQAGTYYLKEITAPANYNALTSNQYWTVVVEAEMDDTQVKSYKVKSVTPSADNTMGEWTSVSSQQTLVIKNDPILASLTIQKAWNGIREEDRPAEIIVKVTGPNGYEKNVALTSSNGVYNTTLNDLYLGEYKIEEGYASVNGYELTNTVYTVDNNSTNTVTLDESTDNPTVTITNTYTELRKDNYATLTIQKHVSGTHAPLAGVTFTLHAQGCSQTGCSCVSVTTDSNGIATFTDLMPSPKDGAAADATVTYTLKETTPAGYQESSETWTVQVKEQDGKATLTLRQDGSNIWDHIYDWIAGVITGQTREEASVYSNGVLYVHNVPKTVNVNVSKVEKFFLGDQEVTDPDVIQLMKNNIKLGDTPAISPSYTFTKADRSTFTLGTVNGTTSWNTSFAVNYGDSYSVQEAAGNYNTTITNSQTGAVIEGSLTSGTISNADLNQDINIVFTNTYRFTENMNAALEFTKTFSDSPETLPTAEFTLYKQDAHGNLVQVGDSVTTGTDGKFGFTVTEAGTYIVRETNTPDGYKTAADVTVVVQEIYQSEVTDNTTNIVKTLKVASVNGNTGATTATIVNEKNPGVVNFTKSFVGITDVSDRQKAEIIMHVHGPIDYDTDNQPTAESFQKKQSVTLAWDDNSGKLTGTAVNLEKGATYLVHEALSSIHGYNFKSVSYGDIGTQKMINDIEYREINIGQETSSQTYNFTVTNTYEQWQTGADFDVYKIDSISKEPIPNVAFTLHNIENCTNCTENGCQPPKSTDGNGKVNFSVSLDSIPSEGAEQTKHFYLTENTPYGYVENTTVYRVELLWSNKAAAGSTPNWQIDVHVQVKSDDVWVNSADFSTTHDQLTIENTPIMRKISLTKTFVGSDLQPYSDTNQNGIQQVSFDIVDSTKQVVDTLTVGTDNNWTDTSKELRLGTYTIEENGADRPRYDLDITYKTGNTNITGDNDSAIVNLSPESSDIVTVTANNVYTAKRELLQVPDTFQVYKVNEHNQPLDGAEFTLHTVDGTHDCTASNCQTKGTENGYVTFTVSGTSASVKPSEAPVGATYYLKESKAPDGYQLPNMSWTVTVSDDDGQIKIAEHPTNDTFVSIVDWIAKLFTDGTHQTKTDEKTGSVWYAYDNELLTVKNVPKTTKLTVTKKLAFELDGKTPTSEQLTLLKQDAGNLIADTYQIQATIGNLIHVKNVKNQEHVDFEIAYQQAYQITEVIPENAAFVSTLQNAENETIGSISGTIDTLVGGEPEGAAFNVTNTYSFVSRDDHEKDYGTLRTCVELQKLDGETGKPLSGAVFTLYQQDKHTQVGDPIVTNAEGKLHLDFTAAGTYYLKETAAPKGYALSGEEIEIVVTPSVERSVEDNDPILIWKLTAQVENGITSIENVRTPISLTVNKVWDDSNYYARPESVEVELRKIDGQTITSLGKKTLKDNLIGEDWTYTWTNLDPYCLYEVVETPIDQTHRYVTSYSDESVDYLDAADTGTATVTVTNTRTPKDIKVTVKKIWRGGAAESVTVKLYRNGKVVDTVKLSKDNNWSHAWDSLNGKHLNDSQEYTVDEVRVSGYHKKVSNTGNDWVVTNTVSVIPETGDYILIAVGIMVVSAAALALVLMIAKKRKHR